ncbi:penicillin acylase family protein [Glaciecola petra]|uniref:Penicillin acylase family protein n=1 Tax=Glaciecola petra TaxID=3075602 RepID=A0ABU2ZQL8_9ALTE|nr:penicillin acylase family protein [Aestuariibacter sp. P117]MDT0594928.1 penicillin acylase family protein [Aestuariibacter sp. P117]
MKLFSLKKIIVVILTLGLIVLLIAQLSLPSKPSGKEYIALAKKYDVEVLRDPLGIPHVYGKTDGDTAFGLAYVQSEDDFETLQSIIIATRGMRSAEVGFDAIESDFVVQFMGVWDTVNAHYDAKVPEKIKLIAQAYADGVNLYAAENLDAVSRYLLPVTAKDVIAGFTFKTPMFYGFDKILSDVVNGNLLIAEASENSVPIGSQGIAIAPHRSAEGQTHLLINSHQPLTGPVAWYEARLNSEEGWNMAGSTFPGAPVIIHGHNESLGWANTVNKPDLVDVYQLNINPDNDNQYLLDGKWTDFSVKTAKLTVKLLGPIRWTFNKDIKISQHGPVMETEHGLFAMRWAGMNEVRTLEFMLDANKAKNINEFEAAIKLKAMPSINFVYADKDGNIAHYYNAQFPKRSVEADWLDVLPGDRSNLIWNEYHDFTLMPKTHNPVSGLVYNANNPPWQATDGADDAKVSDYPASMGIESFVTNRALQIEALFATQEKISMQALKEAKYDLSYHPQSNQIRHFSAWLAEQKDSAYSTLEAEALSALRKWNLSTHKDNEQAALAVMTLEPVQTGRGKKVSFDDTTLAFKTAVSKLVKYHGSFEVPYGEVFRLKRGNKNLAMSGGPDILRAVYGQEMDENGQIENIAGDGFMMFVSWDKNGLVSSEAIHQYGAATDLQDSPHYNDQMEMFVDHKERRVLFEREEVEKQAKRRYRPGQ